MKELLGTHISYIILMFNMNLSKKKKPPIPAEDNLKDMSSFKITGDS